MGTSEFNFQTLHEEEFNRLTSRFGSLVSALKLPISSNANRIFESFNKSDQVKQKTFLNKIKMYINLIELSNVENIDVLRDKRFIWKSLKELNIFPTSDLFESITHGDCVEIYDSSGIQIFSNFEFCTVTSYTFEEIIWYKWEELFSRDEKHTHALYREFNKCFSEATGLFKPDIEDHLCWETMSSNKKRATVSMKMFSPIFGSDKKAKAMIATSKIQLLI